MKRQFKILDHLLMVVIGMKDLTRFITAHEQDYATALAEIKAGKKRSHWMWYIFPQIRGLGMSPTSQYYAIADLGEAKAFLQHPLLGQHLIEISHALLRQPKRKAIAIFGGPDDLKLRSSMTLFANVPDTNPVFQVVLEEFFAGEADAKTLALIE